MLNSNWASELYRLAVILLVAAGIGWSTVDIRGRFRNEPQCIDTAKVLIAGGASVNAANNGGQTALHGSAQLGWTQFVRFLAASGANLGIKDGRGTTALDIAMGRAGTTGRAGVAGAEAHPETAAALRELQGAAAPATAPAPSAATSPAR